MKTRPVIWKAVLLTALSAVGCAEAPAFADVLPPIACVETLRVARIAGESGDSEAQRRAVEAAVKAPGCELPALIEVVRLQQVGGLPAERAAEARRRLGSRLEDPAVELPEGFLGQLVSLAATPEERERLLGGIERRREANLRSGRSPGAKEGVEIERAIAGLQESLDRLEPARAAVERLLAIEPSTANRWRALELDLELERWESAVSLLRELLPAASVGGAHLEQLYVKTLARLGRYEEVEARLALYRPEELGADVVQREWLAEVCVDAAWALRDAGRDAEAESLFRRGLALAPDQPEAHLALLHLYAGEEERSAHAAAVSARRGGESDAQALYEEGTQLLAAGDAASAIDLLARAAPGLAGGNLAEAAWYNLGLAAYRLERWPEAAAAFREAGALNPDRAETFLQLGIALQRTGACTDAVATLRRALKLAPERYQAHYYLARCLETLGDAEGAARARAEYERGRGGG